MIDYVDFDKIGGKLYKLDCCQVATPLDFQEKFNKIYKKSASKGKRPGSKTQAPRKRDGKNAPAENNGPEEVGLTREEKRIMRHIQLMEHLEDGKGPKKIKKPKHSIKINEDFNWEGLTLAEYLQRHFAKSARRSNEAPVVVLPLAHAEDLIDCFLESRDRFLIKPKKD